MLITGILGMQRVICNHVVVTCPARLVTGLYCMVVTRKMGELIVPGSIMSTVR